MRGFVVFGTRRQKMQLERRRCHFKMHGSREDGRKTHQLFWMIGRKTWPSQTDTTLHQVIAANKLLLLTAASQRQLRWRQRLRDEIMKTFANECRNLKIKMTSIESVTTLTTNHLSAAKQHQKSLGSRVPPTLRQEKCLLHSVSLHSALRLSLLLLLQTPHPAFQHKNQFNLFWLNGKLDYSSNNLINITI